jgi:hypothetical protein
MASGLGLPRAIAALLEWVQSSEFFQGNTYVTTTFKRNDLAALQLDFNWNEDCRNVRIIGTGHWSSDKPDDARRPQSRRSRSTRIRTDGTGEGGGRDRVLVRHGDDALRDEPANLVAYGAGPTQHGHRDGRTCDQPDEGTSNRTPSCGCTKGQPSSTDDAASLSRCGAPDCQRLGADTLACGGERQAIE